IGDFTKDVIARAVKDKVVDELAAVRKTLGDVGQWTATLPTHGVYADVSIGVCSGAEDYYEIQRQFDLESKRLDIGRLRLEVEKLSLENQAFAQGKVPDSLVVDNAGGTTTLNVDVALQKLPSKVEVKGSSGQ